jgi:lipoprotein LprG
MMRRILLVTLALTAAVATACSSDDSSGTSGSQPDGSGLLKDAAASMSNAKSTHFTLTVNGKFPALPVHKAEGDVAREGDSAGSAKGTISMDFMGSLFEGDFVLVDNSLYFKGPTGDWQKVPASMVTSIYDPGALLDPDRGVAKVLGSAQNAKTEGTEDIDGVSTYRVTSLVGMEVVKDLVPGIDSDVNVTFWVRQDDGHQPVKASVKVADNATVDVTLADIDKQVSITAPK